MNDTCYAVVWTGSTGWLDRDYGKGALLPPYHSATTLSEAIQQLNQRERHEHHTFGTQRRYSDEEKITIRRMAKNGIPSNVIAKHVDAPLSTVEQIMKGR